MRSNKYGFRPPESVQDPRPGMCYPLDGAAWVSPRGDLAYVPIPKCASTQMQRWCEQQGWRRENYHDTPQSRDRRFLVLMRDPRERWISAVKEWINHAEYDWHDLTRQSRDIIRRHIICDWHTIPQYRYLVGLRLAQIEAVDVRPGEHTSCEIQRIMAEHGHDCWLDPQRNRYPDIAEVREWVDPAHREPHDQTHHEMLERFLMAYADDYWLRCFLLDEDLPEQLRRTRLPMPGDR